MFTSRNMSVSREKQLSQFSISYAKKNLVLNVMRQETTFLSVSYAKKAVSQCNTPRKHVSQCHTPRTTFFPMSYAKKHVFSMPCVKKNSIAVDADGFFSIKNRS